MDTPANKDDVRELAQLSARLSKDFAEMAKAVQTHPNAQLHGQYLIISALNTQNMLLCEILHRLLEKE